MFNLQIKGGPITPCSIAPARSELGTSSLFTQGLLNALYALNSL
jgi:galactokinase/mevalonate kinase-like predicted kinase